MGELIPFPPPLPPGVCRNCKSKSVDEVAAGSAKGLRICGSCGTLQDSRLLREFNEWLKVSNPHNTLADFLEFKRKKEENNDQAT